METLPKETKGKNRGQFYLSTINLIIVLAILFFLTLVITYYFVKNFNLFNEPGSEIKVEIVRSLLDVMVVTIIGGTVAALFKTYERNQEQAKIRTQVKLEFINNIGKLYREVKKSRRLLRARGIMMAEPDSTDETKKLKTLDREQIKFYLEQMVLLNEVQLEIEGYKIAAENFFLFEDSNQMAEPLWRMENYLNGIIGEFEKKYPLLIQNEKAELSELRYLREFTSGSKNKILISEKIDEYAPKEPDEKIHYNFKKLFSLSYGKIVKDLARSIENTKV